MRRNERILYAVIALIFGAALIVAYDMNAKIALYPKIISSLGCLLSLVLIAQSFFQENKEKQGAAVLAMNRKPLDRSQRIRIAASLGIVLAYILSISRIGYIVSTFVFMVVLMTFLKKRFRAIYAVVAFVFVALVYLTFTLFLKIPLPKGLLF